MAALVVQSRFAGLQLEEDDYPSSNDTQKLKKTTKTTTAKKNEPLKKLKTNNNNNKTQTAPKKKKVKQEPTAAQWELWKQKDEQLVDGNFETELQEAILLSKLDYEKKKDVYKQTKKEADSEKKASEQNKASNKKQKKKNVMSLEQFNDMVNGVEEPAKSIPEEVLNISLDPGKSAKKDTEFFDRVEDDVKNELLKDKINDRVKRQQASLTDEIMTRVQFIDTIEKKDKQIEVLQQEVSSLKQELVTVKSRNRKLCNILGQGEMKDKAEVLVEVERLRSVQAELTAEIESLHTDLEKERSKNAQDPRTKDKKKKGASNEKEK